MKIALIGAGGKLGSFLAKEWAPVHEVDCLTRAEVDLCQPDDLTRVLAERDFEVLVNCAAVSSPDQCEDEPETARVVNAVAPQVMARACREHGARMVHFSTDYVLDGSAVGLKDEGAAVYPNGEYGKSKRLGEDAVMAEDARSLICRISWVFGTEPPGFCESILQRAQAGVALEAIADKWSMPTYAKDIASWVEELIPREDLAGIFHLTNTGEPQSWWTYGSTVLAQAHALGMLETPAKILPTRMTELNVFKVPRPVHTAMTPRRLQDEAGIVVRPWVEAARERLGLMAAGEECD